MEYSAIFRGVMGIHIARYNPHKFPLNSWNYRCLRLRRAMGWSQYKLARISGISRYVISMLEMGRVTRPSIDTIRKIKIVESGYEEILRQFDKHPARLDRLRKLTDKERGRVRLLPVSLSRPEDIQSLGEVETNSKPLFFGRKTRKRMQQTGMSLSRKEYLSRRNKAISQGMLKKHAERRSQLQGDNKE